MTTPTPHGAMPELPFSPLLSVNWADRSKTQTLYTADQMREYARAAIQQAAGAVPEGWRLVPVEPTKIMQITGAHFLQGRSMPERDSASIYRAMMCLDDANVPRSDDTGMVYSLWGRIKVFASTTQAAPSAQELAVGAFYPQVTGYATHPLVVGAGGGVGAGEEVAEATDTVLRSDFQALAADRERAKELIVAVDTLLAEGGMTEEDPARKLIARKTGAWFVFPAVATPAAEQGSGDWGIDTSTGTPILIYKNCSVIESEQARYVLRLIAAEQGEAKP